MSKCLFEYTQLTISNANNADKFNFTNGRLSFIDMFIDANSMKYD